MDRRSFLGTSAKIGVAGVVGGTLLASCGKKEPKIVPLRQPGEYYIPELLICSDAMYNGLDVLRKLKSDVRYARIPVIVMTADSEAEVECLTLGAIDFIPKPYPMQKVVLARVLRTIELSEDRDILRWTERDQLTGLYNKDFFYRYAMQLDVYHKDDPTDAVLMNINHFHTINDRYGKSYGDEVLRRIGAKLLELVEETGGIACRSEADTFLLYRPCTRDYEKLPEEIASCVNEGESENRIRLRMGVYSRVDKALDIERRFDRAKMAADLLKASMTIRCTRRNCCPSS